TRFSRDWSSDVCSSDLGINGYTPAEADFAAMSQLDREDEARKLIEEAGYGPGGKPLKIEIRYNTNDAHKKVATAIADMWKEVLRSEERRVGKEGRSRRT